MNRIVAFIGVTMGWCPLAALSGDRSLGFSTEEEFIEAVIGEPTRGAKKIELLTVEDAVRYVSDERNVLTYQG